MMSRSLSRIVVVLTMAVAVMLGTSVLGTPSAIGAPQWAPAATAPVHPGVQTDTRGNGCTANFIFTDGTNVYIGQAAHCSGTGGNTDVNGCTAAVMPTGIPVGVQGASDPGTLVYNSWVQMQAEHEANPDLCAYNDLALIQLSANDAKKVNPSIPHWGGPTGLNTSGAPTGMRVFSYGNSSLRAGITLLSPKTGISVGDTGNGWEHSVVTVTPGIPGDSGSAFLDGSGNALGVLSFLQVLPLPGGNGIGDLNLELAYMHGHSSLGGVSLALGTEPFNPTQVPLDLAHPLG